MSTVFGNFKSNEHVHIVFGSIEIGIMFKHSDYYNTTFIEYSNLSENQLKRVFGDVRHSRINTLYMPYALQQIVFTNDAISVYGESSYRKYRICTPITIKHK